MYASLKQFVERQLAQATVLPPHVIFTIASPDQFFTIYGTTVTTQDLHPSSVYISYILQVLINSKYDHSLRKVALMVFGSKFFRIYFRA